ncbi:hypothetical protein FORC77_1311 [Vibrio vulnificus]|nr:hypothetical protein FORC77_1311 [Vibrio vulnificus]
MIQKMTLKLSHRKQQHNKAFKTDSQRRAFLVWLSFGVYGGSVKLSDCALLTT